MTASSSRGTCFVIVGFGRKTDARTGREIDFEAVYERVRDVIHEVGFESVRLDPETAASSDLPIEPLLEADLVIADLSGGVWDVMYQLGIRHGLTGAPAILLTDDAAPALFDLKDNRLVVYERGERGEVGDPDQMARHLIDAMAAVTREDAPERQSPVYVHLPKLRPARWDEDEMAYDA